MTVPWMQLLYTEKAGCSNLETQTHLQQCVTNIKAYRDDPETFLRATHNAFGQLLDRDDQVLAALFSKADPLLAKDTVRALAEGLLGVCDRQLAKFLSTEFTDGELLQAKSAQSHNMQAERVMAMSDAGVRRAPNASIGFIEAKIKAKTNQSLTWLESLPAEEKDETIKYLVAKSRLMSSKKNSRQKEVEAEIVKRLEAKSQKKDAQQRNRKEKKVVALEKVESGHVTPEAVAELGDIPSGTQDALLKLFNSPKDSVGLKFLHTWFDEERDANSVYRGEILKKKKKKKMHICCVVS